MFLGIASKHKDQALDFIWIWIWFHGHCYGNAETIETMEAME